MKQTCVTSRRFGVLLVDLVRDQRRRDEPAQHRRRLIVATQLLLVMMAAAMAVGKGDSPAGGEGERQREESGVPAVLLLLRRRRRQNAVLESANRAVGRRFGREERGRLQILRENEKGCTRLYQTIHSDPELLTIMIAIRLLNSIVGNNLHCVASDRS